MFRYLNHPLPFLPKSIEGYDIDDPEARQHTGRHASFRCRIIPSVCLPLYAIQLGFSLTMYLSLSFSAASLMHDWRTTSIHVLIDVSQVTLAVSSMYRRHRSQRRIVLPKPASLELVDRVELLEQMVRELSRESESALDQVGRR